MMCRASLVLLAAAVTVPAFDWEWTLPDGFPAPFSSGQPDDFRKGGAWQIPFL